MAVLGYDQAQIPHGGFYQFAKRELYVLIPREFKLSYPLLESSQHHEYISLEELKISRLFFRRRTPWNGGSRMKLFSQTGYEPNVINTASDLYVSLELTSAGFGFPFCRNDWLSRQIRAKSGSFPCFSVRQPSMALH